MKSICIREHQYRTEYEDPANAKCVLQTGERPFTDYKPSDTVVALHCSGGNPGQWRELALALGPDMELHTPENRCADFGDGTGRPNAHPFTLAEEAIPILQLIDAVKGRVHLVGHSYGGSLALHIALLRSNKIASMALYEPCAFHLLDQVGDMAEREKNEILGLAGSIRDNVCAGNLVGAMREFVDYWSGAGTWCTLKPEHRAYLISWAVNAPIAFEALVSEGTRLSDYRKLRVPVRLYQGSCSPAPVKAITSILLGLLPDAHMDRLTGFGHMGPVTQARTVARLIVDHIATCSTRSVGSTGFNSHTARVGTLVREERCETSMTCTELA